MCRWFNTQSVGVCSSTDPWTPRLLRGEVHQHSRCECRVEGKIGEISIEKCLQSTDRRTPDLRLLTGEREDKRVDPTPRLCTSTQTPRVHRIHKAVWKD
mmetsp:Transcript_1901/g.11597  ORF Transcript_1901/g.11597 Transcript_1901/m.11597 type:complete len:99 (-) Transcript_1901:296-592(-)